MHDFSMAISNYIDSASGKKKQEKKLFLNNIRAVTENNLSSKQASIKHRKKLNLTVTGM